jgi:hypothetical protein
MSTEPELTPDDVLAGIAELVPPDCIVQAAIVIVQTYQPGGEDNVARGPWLRFRRDTTFGSWNHLGMLETLGDDIRQSLADDPID